MICKRTFTKTPVAGALSWNTDDYRGYCLAVTIQPTTSTTTYDFSMTDDQSIIPYQKKGNKGTMRDVTQFGFFGIYTLAIANASVNEEFKVQIIYREIPS